MGDRGVSVLVAVITLLGMTVALAGALALVLTKFQPKEMLEVELEIQRGIDRFGGDELILIHAGGGRVGDAFSLDDGKVEWMDLEMRINGVKINVSGATLNGKDNVGKVDFMTDNTLRLPLGRKALSTGDWVTVIYNPQSRILLQTEI